MLSSHYTTQIVMLYTLHILLFSKCVKIPQIQSFISFKLNCIQLHGLFFEFEFLYLNTSMMSEFNSFVLMSFDVSVKINDQFQFQFQLFWSLLTKTTLFQAVQRTNRTDGPKYLRLHLIYMQVFTCYLKANLSQCVQKLNMF